MNTVARHIKDDFGISIQIQPLDRSELARLPLFVRSGVELYEGKLSGVPVLWAEKKDLEEITPTKLRKQVEQLEKYFQKIVVFILPKLESWIRSRLIENQVAFVEPGRQLYIPQLFLQLSEIPARGGRKLIVDKLSFPAQSFIIDHLNQGQSMSGSFQELARRIDCSAMTISRIARELESLEIVTIEGGRPKQMVFTREGKALWEKAHPFLSSPVKEIWFTNEQLSVNHFVKAGNSALSAYTDINDIYPQTFAIGKESFKDMRDSGMVTDLNKYEGRFLIEVWHYDPLIIRHEGGLVDRLSLYLTMEGVSRDDRVKAALEELLKEHTW